MIARAFAAAAITIAISAGAGAAERAVIPVVGSLPGQFGAQFRTSLQLHNPGAEALTGRLIFRAIGSPGSSEDPSINYTLAPRATVNYENVLTSMNVSGLGSIDIVADTTLPVAVARAFDDSIDGTKGVSVPLLREEEALQPGQGAGLISPSSDRARMNVGIRTLGQAVRLRVILYRADGTIRAELGEREYPAEYFVQSSAAAFLQLSGNQSIGPNEAIGVQVIEGRAFVYATMTDNKTNDPSLQIAERRNSIPIAQAKTIQVTPDSAVTVTLDGLDTDGEHLLFEITSPPSHGTLGSLVRVDDDTVTVEYLPGATFTGSDSFTFRVDDENGGFDSATIALSFDESNTAPVAPDQNVTTQEDRTITITLTASDADGDALVFTIVTPPEDGTVGPIVQTGPTTATITYRSRANFGGADSFVYEVTDPDGATDRGTVRINVTGVNDRPTANPNTYSVAEDNVLNVPAPGVLGNDNDVDDSNLTATQVSSPSNGTLVLNANGSFTYTPNANFFGTDSFSYTASDGTDSSFPAVVTITVTPVNDAPTFTAGGDQTINEDAGSQTVTPWATAISAGPANESAQTLTFNITGNDNPLLFASGPAIAANGTLTYTAAANANGIANITVTLSDNGGTANGGVNSSAGQTFTITVTAVDDLPVAVNDAATVNEDDPATAVNVLANDTDVDGGAMTISSVTQPPSGAVVITGGGTGLTYQPNANLCGSDSFTYTLNGGSTATVTMTVTCVNDAPSFTASANATSDEDAGAQSVASFMTAISAGPNEAGQTLTFNITGNDNPSLFASGPTVSTNGTLTYTAAPNANGTANITVTLSDDGGTANGGVDTSAAQPFTITVNAVDDLPVAVNDAATVNEDDPATAVSVLANDTDVDGGTLTISSVTQPVNGTVVITGGGTGLTYQPNANFCGSDSFTYTLNGGSTATVTMTVTCVDDLPTAVDDATSLNEDAPATAIAVLANDTDVDAGPMSIVSVTQPGNGTVVITGGGTGLTYQPNANFCGAIDVFTYTLNGGSIGTVSVTVNCVDDLPVAVNDGANLTEDDAATAINVLGNDTDTDLGPMNIISVTQGTNGTVVITGGGTGLTYQPNPNFCGADSFTYTLNGGSTATVNVTVGCVDDAPTAVNDALTISEDAAATAVNVLANDTDPDGGAISITGVTQGANGAVGITGGGTGLTYAPNSNFCGTDTFTYTLTPGGSTATVTMTVNCINDAPVANVENFAVVRGGTLTIVTPGVLSNDTDVEGSTLTASVIATTTHGTLTLNPDGSLQYINDGTAFLSDGFSYRANDGSANSNTVTVTITITQSNLPPEAMPDSYNVVDGGTLSTTAANGVLQNDSDPEGAPLTAILVGNVSNGTLSFNADGSFDYTHDGSATTTDSFTYQANDGQASSGTVTVTITITASNNAPVAVNDAYNVAKGGALTVNGPGVLGNDTDADSDALTATIVTNGQNGIVTLNADGSFTYVHDNSATTSDTFTYNVSDGQATSNTATVTISIHAVNVPPVAVADSGYTTNEDGVFNQAAPGVLTNDTDADGDMLTAILVTQPANGTVVLNSDGSFVYNPAPNFSGSDSFSYKANDGLADSNTVTVSITVNNINDAPVVSAGSTVGFTENGAAVTLEPGFVLTDDDSPMMQSAQVIITGNADLANDVLACGACGGLTVNYSAGTLNISGADTVANYQSALRSVTFASTGDDPSAAQRTIDWFVSDGSSSNLDNAANNTTVNVTVINDAPTFTTLGNQTVNEDTGPHSVSGFATGSTVEAGQTLSYVIDSNDNSALFSVQPSIAANGTLTYTLTANASGTAVIVFHAHDTGGIANGGVDNSATQSFDIIVNSINDNPTANDDSITINEDSGASAINVLANDVFTPDTGETLSITAKTDGANGTVAITGGGTGLTYTPNANFAGPDSFTYTINDGNGGTDTATVNVTVTALNDAPINTAPIATQTVNQNATITFNAANSNQISVFDVEAATLQVQLGVSSGDLTLSGITGLTFTTGDGTTDAAMTFTGTQSDINAALNNLVYTPLITFSGDLNLNFITSDLGAAGAGGILTDTDAVPIHVNDSNDPPVNVLPAAQTIDEEGTLTLSSANSNAITVTDPDAGTNAVEVTLTASNGTMTLGGITNLTFTTGTGTADATMTFTGTMADINTALNGMTYTPVANFNGAPTITITTDDQGNSGFGGAQTDTDALTVNVTAVNDGPVNTVPGAQTIDEDAVATFAGTISIADADAGTNSIEVALSVTDGVLTLSGTTGLTITGSGNGTASMTLTGTVTDINAALNNMTYAPAPDFAGSDTLSVVTSDLGNTGTPGALTDSDSVAITVTAINDAPSFTIAGDPPFIMLGAGAQNVAAFATSITRGGGADENGQVLTFNFTQTANSGTLTLSAGPSIDPATGNLTYTPNAGTHGTLTFSTTLSDNGSNTAPNVNVSGSQSFTIAVEKTAAVTSTVPLDNASGVLTSTNITVNFDEPVSVTLVPPTFRINCNAGPDLAYAYVGGTTNVTTVTLDPTATLPAGNCVVTVFASEVHDTDTFDPPDGLAVDYVFDFVTNTPPAAVDDSTTALGHVTLTVADAQGVLANDSDPDAGATLSVNLAGNPYTTAQGGTITFTAGGGYTYNSQALDQNITDTVNYTLQDQFGGTDTGTLSINLGPRFIYVDDDHPTVTPDGRDIHPWKTMQQAQTNSVAGDTILVKSGSYTDHIVLQANQSMIGQGIAANHTVTHNAVNFTVLTAGVAPTISRSAAGDTITLSTNNTIRGVAVGSTNGKGIVGTNFTAVTINDNVTVSATGNAALHLDTGAVTATLSSVSATAGANSGLIFNALTGTMDINGGNISNTAGATLSLTGGSMAGTIAANLSTTGSSLVNVAGRTANALILSGALSGSGTISASGNAAGTTLTFSGTQTVNTGTNAGVNLSANSGAINFTGTTLQVTTSTGTGFSATGGGTLTVTGTANITTGAAANGVIINGVTVSGTGVTFTSVNTTGATTGVALTSLGNGNVTVNGGTLNAGTAVSLSTLGSSIVTLNNVTAAGSTTGISGNTFGTLSIGGTVNVSGPTALSLTTGTVSGTFANVSSTGGTSGVSLTGVSGTWGSTAGSLTGASGATFNVSGGSGSISWGGTIAQSNTGTAVTIAGGNSATINFNNNITTSLLSTGISLSASSGTYNFNGSNAMSGAGGIVIANGQSGTIVFSNNTTNTVTGTPLLVDGSVNPVTAAITYGGTIVKGAGGRLIDVNNLDTPGTLVMTHTPAASGNLSINNAGATGISIINSSSPNITIANASITTGATAFTGTNNSGVINLQGIAITANGAGAGMLLAGGGTINVTSGVAASSINMTGATASAINGSSTPFSGTLNLNNTAIVGGGATAVRLSNGALGGTGSTIAAGAQTALHLIGVVLANGAGLSSVTSTGGTSGVILQDVSGGLYTIAGGSLNGNTVAAWTHSNIAVAAATISFAGSITPAINARAIDIGGAGANSGLRGGTITFSGNIITTSNAANANAGGIRVRNSTAGTLTLSGTTISVSSNANIGVELTTNPGTTFNFNGGTQTFTSTSGKAFTATGGGTVNVTGANNTITTTGANGLEVIGTAGVHFAGNIAFRSITAAGGSKGVSLQFFDGPFTIAGTDGADAGTDPDAGTGGSISTMTNRGLELTNITGAIVIGGMNFTDAGTANGVAATTCGDSSAGDNTNCAAAIHVQSATGGTTLNQISINGGNQMGVNTRNVTNLVIKNIEVQNVGDETMENGMMLVNTTGTGSITNGNFHNNESRQVHMYNSTGTLSSFTIKGCTFANSSPPNGNMGLILEAGGASTVMNVTTGGLAAGEGNTFSNLFSNGWHVGSHTNATATFQLIGSAGINSNSLAVAQASLSSIMNLTLDSNTWVSGANQAAGPISLKTDGSGDMIATVTNNTLGVQGVAFSGSPATCGNCVGMFINPRFSTNSAITVTGNTIQGMNGAGIYIQPGESTSYNVNAVVTGNLIREPSSTTAVALELRNGVSGAPVEGAGGCFAVQLGGSVTPAGWPSNSANAKNRIEGNWGTGTTNNEVAMLQTDATTFKLVGYPGGGIPAYIQGQNVITSTLTNGGGTHVVTVGTIVGGTACP